ncbi:MAG: hypothetical protein HW374_1652, partial [Bacteroidetes bacterium]|nr:hypothetical protein [Bacteroidota bacterium]
PTPDRPAVVALPLKASKEHATHQMRGISRTRYDDACSLNGEQ